MPTISLNRVDDLMENLKSTNLSLDDGYAFIWLDHEVILGEVVSQNLKLPGNFKININNIQRFRLFNKSEELYGWKSGDTIQVRYRKDGSGDDVVCVDADQMVWGDSFQEGTNQWTEGRGMKFNIPESVKKSYIKNQRLFIKTRHYVEFSEIGQATYSDVRFVDFIWKGKFNE